MSLYITSLNSGSNGNCYYIGNEEEAVLVDAGISCRETEKRMRRLGLNMETVKAIFISHEHGDHIRGVEGFAAKYKLPIYITPSTFRNSKLRINEQLLNPFKAYESVMIGGLSVLAFPKRHDAIDPHSFIIEYNGIKVGVFTDIGGVCGHVIANFKQCHAIFLESNYDEQMLETGRYPYHLKNRIRGGHGHLSNRQALELFLAHKPAHMTHVFLSHLSNQNNTPELAYQLFVARAGKVNISVASRNVQTPICQIIGNGRKPAKKYTAAPKAIQATLF